jgi:hypothetical protein
VANPAEHSRYSLLLTAVVVVLLLGPGAASSGAQGSACPEVTPAYTGPCGPTFVLPGWGDAGGWTNPEQYETIQLADVDGDGDQELLARTPAGIEIHDFDKTLGQWRPQVDANELPWILSEFADSPPLTVADDPPAMDWARPEYYDTIQAADIDGQKGEEIVARAPAGLIVYKFTPGGSPGHGSWQKLPVSDAFGDPYWGADPSNYTTIQTGDLNGDGDAEVFGRQGDGIVAVNWTGRAGQPWTLLPKLNLLSDADGGKNPAYYTSLQAADIDGDSRQELIGRILSGVYAYKLRAGRWTLVNKRNQPFADQFELADCPFVRGSQPCFVSGPTYYGTIQFADVDGNGRAELLGRASDGVRVRRYKGDTPTAWGQLPNLSALSDANGWTPQEYWETIQFADINADGRAEALARGPQGLNAWSYDPGPKTWTQLSPTTALTLADDPWGSDRSYYSTIETGDVDGDKRADVIARGPYGIRTWFFNRRGTGGWERYQPDAVYPAFAAGQKAAFDELNSQAKSQNLVPRSATSVRDMWASVNAPTAVTLSSLQTGLVTLGNCVNPSPAAPPQYATCTPPTGSSDFTATDWTSVLNEILAELYWAQRVVAHFDDLQGIRQELFIEQTNQLPEIGDDLKLAAAANTPTRFDMKALMASIVKIAGTIIGAGVPEARAPLAFAATLISMFPSATPKLTNPVDGTYNDLRTRFSNSIPDVDKAMAGHSQLVRQDSSLLTLVGQLRDRGTWTTKSGNLDAVGMKSAGRQGFTLSIYKTLLPIIWARYVISGCRRGYDLTDCYGPPAGPWMQGSGRDFTTIGPPLVRNFPCYLDQYETVCNYAGPGADLAQIVWGQVPPSCAYDGSNAATAWTYPGDPSKGGCTLGVDPASTLADPSQIPPSERWTFPSYFGNPITFGSLHASLVGTAAKIGQRRSVMRLSGRVALPRSIRLGRARVVVGRLLHEAGGRGELVRHRSRGRHASLALTPAAGRSGAARVFASRKAPGVQVRLRRGPRRTLSFKLVTRNTPLSLPAACSGTRPGVDLATDPIPLHTRLRIEIGRRAIPIALRPNWKCQRNSHGAVRRLVLQRPPIRQPTGRALPVAVHGPRRVKVGRRPTYRITVRNPRRTTAHDVLVRAVLPRTRSGADERQATWRLRALRPGRSRTFRVRLGAWHSAVRSRCLTVLVGAIDTRPAKKRICTSAAIASRRPTSTRN